MRSNFWGGWCKYETDIREKKIKCRPALLRIQIVGRRCPRCWKQFQTEPVSVSPVETHAFERLVLATPSFASVDSCVRFCGVAVSCSTMVPAILIGRVGARLSPASVGVATAVATRVARHRCVRLTHRRSSVRIVGTTWRGACILVRTVNHLVIVLLQKLFIIIPQTR